MSRYEPLTRYLEARREMEAPLTFREVEAILHRSLPDSARRRLEQVTDRLFSGDSRLAHAPAHESFSRWRKVRKPKFKFVAICRHGFALRSFRSKKAL